MQKELQNHPDRTPVIVEIIITDTENNFVLNSSKFTHFSQEEEEVILQDGIELLVDKAMHRSLFNRRAHRQSACTTMNTSCCRFDKNDF